METQNQVQEDIMFDGGATATIVAALIGLAATAVTSAVSSTLSMVGISSPISCGLVNNTPYKLTRYIPIWEPVHGSLSIAPNHEVLSLLDGAVKENADDDHKWKETNYTTWGLSGRGSGTELLTVYKMEVLNIMISLYAGNPVTGAPYAGVSIADAGWFDNYVNEHKKDAKGHWLIKHIKDVHSDHCQYSKNGRPCTVNNGGEIKIDFASATETVFKVSFTGDWNRFKLPG